MLQHDKRQVTSKRTFMTHTHAHKNREIAYEQIVAWRTEGTYEVFEHMYS